MKTGIKVYVAGPYTKPDPCANTNRAVAVGHELWELGFVPFVPHLSHFWHTMIPRPYQDWLDYDLVWLAECDAVLRLPGESSGAEVEVRAANEQGIPVFTSIEELKLWSTTHQV